MRGEFVFNPNKVMDTNHMNVEALFKTGEETIIIEPNNPAKLFNSRVEAKNTGVTIVDYAKQ